MRVIGYARVSTDEQASEGVSIKVKGRHADLSESDVRQFYKKLAETDPTIQALIVDCINGPAINNS